MPLRHGVVIPWRAIKGGVVPLKRPPGPGYLTRAPYELE
jgi:hypothetical protein